jgi:protein TonB
MSKIDLFDQQWIDLVFEGKNEAYGAYKMRQDTNNRNLMAMLALIGGIAAIVLIFFLYGFAKDSILAANDAKDDKATEMSLTAEAEEEEVEEEEEETPIFDEPEPEQEQVLLEELVNSEKYTDFAMDDEKEKEVIKTAEEANEGTEVTATVEFHEGSEEGNKVMSEEKVIVEEKKEVEEEKVIHNIVEQMPSFPGGNGALAQFLQKNLKYPPIAEENGIKGRVTCQFVVERDGSITDVQVVRGVDPSLDREAIRVIKSMPKWIPGKQNGKAVRVRFTCPITFTLQ